MHPDSVLLALQRATHNTLDALATELADLALPASQLNVLANLADGTPRTVSALATEVGSRASTMTSILDRLVERGLLARSPHPSDRRAFMVELTPDGRRVARRVRRTFDRVEDEALAKLPRSTVAALRRGLAALGATPHAH